MVISGVVGVVFFLAVILAIPSVPATIEEGLAGGFPIATIITDNLSTEIAAGVTFGEVYLLVILASVFVCTLAIQGAATRMMFSMSRDRVLPGGRLWQRQPDVQDASQRGDRDRRPCGPADHHHRSVRRVRPVDLRDRPHLPQATCNIGVLNARRSGWPRQKAWFNLGRWGMPINILALVYGGLMIVNLGLWNDPNLFRDFWGEGRAYWNPFINGGFLQWFGQPLEWLPTAHLGDDRGPAACHRGGVLPHRAARSGAGEGRGRRRHRRGHDRLGDALTSTPIEEERGGRS